MFFLSAQRTWYGIEEVRPFWEFIQTTCRYLPNNCINSMATLENVKSHIGKVRIECYKECLECYDEGLECYMDGSKTFTMKLLSTMC